MTADKPLHLRVHEALGHKPRSIRVRGSNHVVEIWNTNPYYSDGGFTARELREVADRDLPHYDTDWNATGPLIEKHHLNVVWNAAAESWEAIDRREGWDQCYVGETALIALCYLVLALAEAGKL